MFSTIFIPLAIGFLLGYVLHSLLGFKKEKRVIPTEEQIVLFTILKSRRSDKSFKRKEITNV